eukprot:gene16192-biopygen6742
MDPTTTPKTGGAWVAKVKVSGNAPLAGSLHFRPWEERQRARPGRVPHYRFSGRFTDTCCDVSSWGRDFRGACCGSSQAFNRLPGVLAVIIFTFKQAPWEVVSGWIWSVPERQRFASEPCCRTPCRITGKVHQGMVGTKNEGQLLADSRPSLGWLSLDFGVEGVLHSTCPVLKSDETVAARGRQRLPSDPTQQGRGH